KSPFFVTQRHANFTPRLSIRAQPRVGKSDLLQVRNCRRSDSLPARVGKGCLHPPYTNICIIPDDEGSSMDWRLEGRHLRLSGRRKTGSWLSVASGAERRQPHPLETDNHGGAW